MNELIRQDSGQWARLRALVVDSVSAPASKRAYGDALTDFFRWWESEGRPPFTKATVQAVEEAIVDALVAEARMGHGNLREGAALLVRGPHS